MLKYQVGERNKKDLVISYVEGIANPGPVEEAAKKEVNRHVEMALNAMKNKYHVEVAGLGNQLRIHYPKVWQYVKQNWDNKK